MKEETQPPSPFLDAHAVWSEAHPHPIGLQPDLQNSLEEFVAQFKLAGGCFVWLDRQSLQPQSIACSGEFPLPDGLAKLESGVDWGQLEHVPLYETVPLRSVPLTPPEQLYACLCSQAAGLLYLVFWNPIELAEHQQYGITLYARSLQLRFSKPADEHQLHLHTTLQRAQHQLRTPLALILLYVDLLSQVRWDGPSQEWLENLRAVVEEMGNSLNHLTELAPLPQTCVGVYDLRQLFEQSCKALQPWIEKKNLKLVYPTQSLSLQTHGWKLRQVLQNILSNAIAFSPEAGEIACEWHGFQAEVLIKIWDQGPGLSPEDLRSLGTPFYSRRPGGTGLGLFIAKQILSEHRGSLWAENLPDGGAQFCIALPTAKGNTPACINKQLFP